MGYEWISYVRLQDWPKNTPVVWRVFTLVALVQIFGGALLLLPEVLGMLWRLEEKSASDSIDPLFLTT